MFATTIKFNLDVSLLCFKNDFSKNKNQAFNSSLNSNLIFSNENIEINNQFSQFNANTIPKVFKSKNLCFENLNQSTNNMEILSESSKLTTNFYEF